MTLSIANHGASLPIAYRLYLPDDWASDAARRDKTRVPADIVFKTKPEIALDQIAAAHAADVAPGVVLADPAYGCTSGFRAAVTRLGLAYALGAQSNASVWPPGVDPLPAKAWSGRGRPTTLLRRDPDHSPVSVKQLDASKNSMRIAAELIHCFSAVSA